MSRALSADGVSGSEFTLDISLTSGIIPTAGAVVVNEKDSGRPAMELCKAGEYRRGRWEIIPGAFYLKAGVW
jgi:hypothetical protein